jgi:hypothetical protein
LSNILVLHNYGGIGKSTIAGVMLYPRFGGELFSIETANDDASRFGIPVRRFAATEFPAYFQMLTLATTNTITDVGASNFVQFLNHLGRHGGLHLFDHVVVPAEPSDRGQLETIKTIMTLFNAGLQADRLRIVLNKVETQAVEIVGAAHQDTHQTIRSQFIDLVAYAETEPRLQINLDCYLPPLQLFASMAAANCSWDDLISDTTDYRGLLVQTGKDNPRGPERLRLSQRLFLQTMAQKADTVLTRAYNALNLVAIDDITSEHAE